MAYNDSARDSFYDPDVAQAYRHRPPYARELYDKLVELAPDTQRALDLGCKKIFTCTGVDVPGDPQHSYKNILRAGFVEEYVRDNYEPG